MKRNAKNSFLFAVILCIAMSPCLGQNFRLPNLQILMLRNLIFSNMSLNTQSIINISTNEKQTDFQFKLLYQMFVYPFDIYSYINRVNSREYLFVRIDYDKFKQKYKNSTQNYHKSQSSSLKTNNSHISGKTGSNQSKTSAIKQANQEKLIQFSTQQLFQLIPRYLTIHQEEHQQISIQKINQNIIMLTNLVHQTPKHKITSSKIITIYRVNIHSYIYYARQQFINQFFPNSTSQEEDKGNSVFGKIEDGFKTIHQIQQQLKNLQTTFTQEHNLYNRQDVWYKLFSKNSQFIYRFFYEEERYYINDGVLNDYAFNQLQFKLVTVQTKQCPNQSPLKLDFSIFQNEVQKQQNMTQKNCTYMGIFTKVFSTWKIENSVQFISSQNQLSNIKFIQIQYKLQTKDQSELLIGLGNQLGAIIISYGDKQKKVVTYFENPNIKRIFFMKHSGKIALIDQNSVTFQTLFQKDFNQDKIVFKVQQNHTIDMSKNQQNQVNCRHQFDPQILTISQINSELLAVCRQGSYCKVINSYCQVFAQIGLQNAYGLEWSYKIRHIQTGKSQIYLQALKYSQMILYRLPAPLLQNQLISESAKIDQTQIGLVYQKQGRFNYTVKELKVKHILTQRQISTQKSGHQVLIPSFFTQINLWNIKQPQLFSDQIYRNHSMFRNKYLQETIQKQLQFQINKFFNPISSNQSFNYLKRISQEDLESANQILFNGCKLSKNSQQIQFQPNWNMCKINLTPNSFLILQSILKQTLSQKNKNQSLEQKNHKMEQTYQQLIKQSDLQTVTKTIQQHLTIEDNKFKIFQQQMLQKAKLQYQTSNQKINNQILVCSVNTNGQIHQKCQTHKYSVDKQFYSIAHHLRIGLASSKTYLIYFFNHKNMNQFPYQNNYKSKIDQYARAVFDQSSFLAQNKQFEGNIQNKHGYYFQKQQDRHQTLLYDIQLLDIQKMEIQYMETLIFFMLIVFTTILTIISCVFLLKSMCFQILIYYDYINVEPAYIYPLGHLPLKIKIKKLVKKGYLKIVKKKHLLKQMNQICTQTGDQCCFCLQEINCSEDVAQLYCKHRFHGSCFCQWIRNQVNTKCPLCKRQFTLYALHEYERNSNQLKLQKNELLDSEIMIQF